MELYTLSLASTPSPDLNLLNNNDPAVRSALVENSVDLLANLRDSTGLTTAMAVFSEEERRGIVLASLQGQNDHCYVPRTGFHFHLHCTAPGKAYLAALPQTKLSKFLAEFRAKSFTTHTYVDRESLRRAVKQHARKGYATDVGEYVEGVNCVAACIPWTNGRPVAAIWITALSIDLPESRLDEFAGKVIAIAKELAIRLRNLAEDPATQLNSTVESVHRFIELQFLNEESIHDYIQNLNISEKWFRSAFSAKYGISPLKFRQQLVLERAQRLLKNTSLSVKEIAFQLGYDNQNYFSRAFKSHVGQSPLAFKEKPRG